jgi:hypothetical protein
MDPAEPRRDEGLDRTVEELVAAVSEERLGLVVDGPSFRRRTVSWWSTRSPCRIRARMASISPARSAGMISEMGSPTASSAV